MIRIEWLMPVELGISGPQISEVVLRGADWRPTRLAGMTFLYQVEHISEDRFVYLASTARSEGGQLAHRIYSIDCDKRKIFRSEMRPGLPVKLSNGEGNSVIVDGRGQKVECNEEFEPWGIHPKPWVEFTDPVIVEPGRNRFISPVRFIDSTWSPKVDGLQFIDRSVHYYQCQRLALIEFAPRNSQPGFVPVLIDFQRKTIHRGEHHAGWIPDLVFKKLFTDQGNFILAIGTRKKFVNLIKVIMNRFLRDD